MKNFKYIDGKVLNEVENNNNVLKMKFVRNININEIIHCPNCEAEFKNAATTECEFYKKI